MLHALCVRLWGSCVCRLFCADGGHPSANDCVPSKACAFRSGIVNRRTSAQQRRAYRLIGQVAKEIWEVKGGAVTIWKDDIASYKKHLAKLMNDAM